VGSQNFMSFKEAANRLGRSVRSVHSYAKQGFLKKIVRDGKVLLHAEDVEQLCIELGADLPAMNRKTFFQLQARIRQLEEKMAFVEGMWGIGEKPLHPSETETAELFDAVSAALASDAWSFPEMDMWAGLFLRFDETTLLQIAKTGLIARPWELFFELGNRFMQYVGKTPALKTDLQLQGLYRKLEAARKHLRGEAILWAEIRGGTLSEGVLKSLSTPKEDLFRRLGQKPPLS